MTSISCEELFRGSIEGSGCSLEASGGFCGGDG